MRLSTVWALAAVVLFSICRAHAGSEKVLYIYTWEGYFAPEVVAAFEAKSGCRVDFTYYDSNDTMFQTILDDSSGYDLFTPSANISIALREHNVLQPLNHDLLPNMRHLDRNDPCVATDPECAYVIPFTSTVTGIGYNKKQVRPEWVGSWSVLGVPEMHGRTAMLNDVRETLGAALKFLGYSANSTQPAELLEAGMVLKDWKKNIVMFDVVRAQKLLLEGKLAAMQAYNGEVAYVTMRNPDIDFFVPREGSTMNADYFAIPAGAESPELAHEFINYMYDPATAAANMKVIGYFMPNTEAVKELPPEMMRNHAFHMEPEILKNCEMIQVLGESQDLYDEVWGMVLLD